jgi:anti-sigma regulatory factor (Ser/Thr protein kinase)
VGGASAPPVVVVTDEADEAGVLIGHLQLGAASYVPKAAAGPRLVQTVADLITLAGRNPLRDRLRPYMKSGRIEFELGNDLDNVPVTAAFVRMLMDNYALGDEKTRFRLCLALGEALSNAIIHGNLEIGSELREGQTDAYYREIERRVGAEPWASRRVRLLFTFGPDEVTLMVRDAGDGFDLEAVGDPTDPENLLKASGRGLLLMRAYTDRLEWNEAGNEVTLCKALGGGPGDGVGTSSGS